MTENMKEQQDYTKGCISVPLPDDILKEAISNAKDFALLHGKY